MEVIVFSPELLARLGLLGDRAGAAAKDILGPIDREQRRILDGAIADIILVEVRKIRAEWERIG